MKEKNMLSAFFDGESNNDKNAEENQWLESLNDESNLQAWKSYSLMREILRDRAAKTVNWDVSNSVAKALEQEMTYQNDSSLQPVLQKTLLQQPHEKKKVSPLILAQPTPKQVRRTLPNWLQQLLPMGTAAAVAVLVIFGVQQYNGSNNTALAPLNQQPPVLQTIPISGGATPVSLTRDTLSTVDDQQRIEQQHRINEFFQDYELQRRLNAMDLERIDEQKSP